jgi:hypothetical protein
MKIISVSGFIGGGKDTVADYLVQEKGFLRESFAATLKDAVAAVFGWDRELLEGRTAQARKWREQVDTWWAQRLDISHLTPRWILQYWGTEVCRMGFHDDIWIASLERKLLKYQKSVVISDARFPNEFRALTKSGAKTIWVRRGVLPDWYSVAVAANNGHQWAIEELRKLNIHASETAWVGHNFDWVIDNNDSLANLYDCIDDLLAEH